MKDYREIIKHLTGLLILILSIWISRFFPEWIEKHYSLVIFPKLATALKFIFGWISFSLFVPLIVLFIFKLIKSIKKTDRHWISITEVLLKYILFICTAFYILWGYNYNRIKVSDKLALNEDILNDSLILNTFLGTGKRLDSISHDLHSGNDTLLPSVNIKEMVYKSVHSVLIQTGYNNFDIGKLKEFWPKGFLLRISTAGFYMPFTGEANYDGGLHPIQLPFVMCHEYLHSQGFADEGECNFLAYLACHNSNDPLFRYSADIALYKTIRGLGDRSKLHDAYVISDQVKKDLEDIRVTMDKYPDFAPQIRDFMYDLYLKLQGIEEGEHNYDNFVQLLIKYNKQHHNVF